MAKLSGKLRKAKSCQLERFIRLYRHILTSLFFVVALSGCSTVLNESHIPITLSFSDNSAGSCELKNKRENYSTQIPATVSVRRSDDSLIYDCTTADGRKANGAIKSSREGSIWGNVILGGGIGAIVDADKDMHRIYPDSFVIPVVAN